MLNSLNSNPLIELLKKEINPPINNLDLSFLKTKIGSDLPEDFILLYKEFNGCNIQWRFIKESIQIYPDLFKTFSDGELLSIKNNQVFGSINILPMNECLLNKSYLENIYNDNEMVNFMNTKFSRKELIDKFLPFDFFSEYYGTVMILSNNFQNSNFMLLSDYYVEWDYSLMCNLKTYMDLIIKTNGIINIRRKVLQKYQGHSMPLFESKDAIAYEFEKYKILFNDNN